MCCCVEEESHIRYCRPQEKTGRPCPSESTERPAFERGGHTSGTTTALTPGPGASSKRCSRELRSYLAPIKMPPSPSTRASTITTNTAVTSGTTGTFTSVSSFLPPRAEERIHIWLSEVSPSPVSSSLKSDSSTHLAYCEAYYNVNDYLQPPTLNHGRVSMAQLYSTKERGPSLKQRLKKLAKFGRKEKGLGFAGEREGGDLSGADEMTAMYDVEVSEMAPRASLQIEQQAAASAARSAERKEDEGGIAGRHDSDFGAGIADDRRLMDREMRRVRRLSAV